MLKGSDNGNARLHEIHVHDIRLRYLAGWSLRQLAGEYNVSHMTIKRICAFKTWKHVNITTKEMQDALAGSPTF